MDSMDSKTARIEWTLDSKDSMSGLITEAKAAERARTSAIVWTADLARTAWKVESWHEQQRQHEQLNDGSMGN